MQLSGLEPLVLNENSNFINVGERTNVAGSRKFLRLVKEEKFDEALDIARHQVDGGAQIIDVNFDDGLIDGKESMIRFLNLIAAEPDIAYMTTDKLQLNIRKTRKAMEKAAKELDFIEAARLRDFLKKLQVKKGN